MFNYASLILGIISYIITWYISSSIQSAECNSKAISYCINLLLTISTVLILLPFLFVDIKGHNILSFIMTVLYLIVLLILTYNISNTKCIPNLWYDVVPMIFLMLLVLIYSEFNITRSLGVTTIIFGLYYAIFHLIYYFIKNDFKLYNAFITLCGLGLIVFGVITVQYTKTYQYTKIQ